MDSRKNKLKNWIALILLLLLAGCGGLTQKDLRILDRPPKFTECDYRAVPDGQWCLDSNCYMLETQHILKLNHIIDRYEMQVEEFND